MMIKQQDLIEDAITMISHFDAKYTHLLPLLQASTWQDFETALLALGEKDGNMISLQNKFAYYQKANLTFLIISKLKKFNKWSQIDFKRFMPSLKYLQKEIEFILQYELIHEKCMNIFDAYLMINFKNQANENSKKLRAQFLANSLDALFNQNANKESYSYKCISNMSEEQKQIFQVLAVNTYNKFHKKNQDEAKKNIVYQKYINTNNPKIFNQLLDINSGKMEQTMNSILQLKIVNKDNEWLLDGEYKYNSGCLNVQNMIKCLTNSSQLYRHLAHNFIYFNETEIIFKFDIQAILKNTDKQSTFFGIKTTISQGTKHSQIKQHLQTIMNRAYNIITSIKENKKMVKFVQNRLVQIPKQVIILFCLKILTYPFRTKHTFIFKQSDDWDDSPQIVITIDVPLLQNALIQILQHFTSQNTVIPFEIMNTFCQLMRWIDQNSRYESQIKKIFANDDKEKNLNPYFIQLLSKYLKEEEGRKLPYHTGIWLIKYLNLQQNPKELMGEHYVLMYNTIYTFITENNRYLTVHFFQLKQYVYKQRYKLQFYKLVQNFIAKSSQFAKITFDLWMKELEYFQKNKYDSQTNRKYRLAIIVIIFNSQHFPVTQQLKHRLKKLLLIDDFQHFKMNSEYRYIWQTFMNKINFDVMVYIEIALQQALTSSQDHELMARQWQSFYYRTTQLEGIKCFVKSVCWLLFILKTGKCELTQTMALKLTDITINLKMVQCQLKEKIQISTQKYSLEELQWLNSLEENCFRSFLGETFIQYFQDIENYLKDQANNILISNAVIIRMGGYLKYLIQNHKKTVQTQYLMELIIKIIRRISSKLQIELFPQFYNYHKEAIIDLIELLFKGYPFKFDGNDPSGNKNQISFAFKAKKQGKDVKQSWSTQNLLSLENQLKNFIKAHFSNEDWQYTIIFNNIKYEKVNNLKLFQRTLHNDLASRLANRFTPQKISNYYQIFSIIDGAYHRRSRDDLQCAKSTLNIEVPAEPLVLFAKISEFATFFQTYKDLIKKLFGLVDSCDATQDFEGLYNILKSELDDEERVKIQKDILQQLINSLHSILASQEFIWDKYVKMHGYINSVLSSYEQSIGSLLSKEFLSLYFARMSLNLKNNLFSKESSKPFLMLVERIVPDTKPELYDEIFDKYSKNTVYVCNELLKGLKTEDIQSNIVSLIAKIIRLRNPAYEQYLLKLFERIQNIKDTFSQLFCQLIEPQLRLASIQLEIKSYFLMLLGKNKDKSEDNCVKVTDFVKTFSNKHRYHKKQFISAAEALTIKMTIKEEDSNNAYLKLKSPQQLDYSIMLGKRFIDSNFNSVFKQILSSYVNGIDVSKKGEFGMKIKQLRIISFNYPILTSFILMHPKTCGQRTMPLIDFLFQKFTTEIFDQQLYAFFGYLSLDICLIIKAQEGYVFFSEYLCYRLIAKIMQGQITNSILVFIFGMVKVRRFSQLCFKQIKNDKSLCDSLWDKLASLRQGFAYSGHHHILIYAILAIIYRSNNVVELMKYCQYKRNNDNWENYNNIVNQSWFPFKNLVLKNSIQQNQVFKITKTYELTHESIYRSFDQSYHVWYEKSINKEQNKIEAIQINEINLSSDHIKHLGSIAKTHSREYFDIESQISASYFHIHSSSFQVIHIYFLDHENNHTATRRRRRNKDSSYNFFTQLHEDDDENEPQSSNDQELQAQVNANRQSNFAPEEFVRVRNRKKSQDEDSSDFQKELQAKLNDFSNETVTEDAIIEERIIQFTDGMFDIMNKINQRFSSLKRPLLHINDIKGKTLEEKLQFLQAADLQSDFDLKQATMSIDQFENYCLANVNKLDRLGSQRRNIVRNIEDVMLLKYVQRSVSSDSVDYIIDTIDQNYQLLPNTLTHKLSVGDYEKKLENKDKVDKKARFINGASIPLENYEAISDERLYQAFLALYYTCATIEAKNFIPFLQNKQVQAKIINTLLFIYKNPFGNSLFPDKLNTFDLQNLKWQTSESNDTSLNEIRQKIADIFISGKSNAFYEEENFLNNEINFEGIKGLIYQPSFKSESSNETYKPTYQVLELILAAQLKKIEKDNDYKFQHIFGLFDGVAQLNESLLQKFMTLLKQIHRVSVQFVKNQSQNIDSDQINSRTKQAKAYNLQNNLKPLIKSQKIREMIKSTFPIESEDRDPFFVYLFMNTGVYSRDELIKFHKLIIQKDVPNSSNVFFSNMAFKLPTDQELRQYLCIKQSKNILPCIIKSLPNRGCKLKEQPIYRICNFPHFLVIQFKSQLLYRKVKDFRSFFSFQGSQEVVAQRKKGIFQSAFLDLRNRPDGFWYESFSVKFMNDAGTLESGYGRGVAKDWYTYVTKGMANLNYGIFMKTSKNYYFFNRESWINPRHLQFLQFIGKIFALSIINKQFYLGPSFSILIYKMIVGEKIEINDIVKEFDEGQVIKNIEKLRDYHDDSLFCESFVYEDKRLISNKKLQILKRKRSMQALQTNTKENNLYLIQEAVEMKMEETEDLPKLNEMSQEQMLEQQQAPKMIKVIKIGQTIQLVPEGANIAVNMENLQQFITLTKQKIYDTIVNGVKQQFNAFMSGFKRVVKPEFIQSITAEELREIAEGCDKISVDDLKEHVTLGRGMDKNEQTQWFWSCLEKLSARDRMYLIQHWTGLPKISAEGFKGTNLTIVKGQYHGRLFAQTCFNKLHLPQFENREKMEEAITMVINSVKIGQSIIQD